jgi:hypothetical protein
MPSSTALKSITELANEFGVIAESTKRTFGSLTAAQLNWKPANDSWSIAQCLDHLFTANKAYFPVFERVARAEKKNTLWESMPLIPGLFGKLLIKSLEPTTKRKLKAPKAIEPAISDIDTGIVDRFLSQQAELAKAFRSMEHKDLDRIRMTSPFVGFITYSLRDACIIIVVHEQRHLQQAERVLSSPGFPVVN